MSDHKNALPIGYQLKGYTIEKLLGHGGFGITYLAKHERLKKLVAIKEYLPQEFALREDKTTVVAKSSSDKELYDWGLDSFESEAEILARFKHPNIVRVIDIFSAHNTAYLIMEYEPGETLYDYLNKHGCGLTEKQIISIFIPILDGLRAVHDVDLLHRDITPDNIYLRTNETPMLIDFGSARFALGDKTQSLTTMVKPGYAPFEQYSSDSKRQGAWTDLYSIAASMYFCVIGKKIPDANDRSAALNEDEADPYQPLSKLVKGKYSDKFLTSIDWALEFKIKDRPQNVRDFQQELAPTIISTPTTPTPTPIWKYIAIGGIVCILGVGGLVVMGNNKEPVIRLSPFEQLIEQADSGDINAQYQLASTYNEKGDLKSARAYYRKAALNEHAQAQYKLGEMYLAGKGGLTIDPKEAIDWFEKSTTQGNEKAVSKLKELTENVHTQHKLALNYYDQENYKATLFFLKKAASAGDPTSQFKLGEMYKAGEGVAQSTPEALVWFKKSALQKNVNAQFKLAGIYFKDQTDDNNYNRAKLWFKKSSDQGYSNAQKVYKNFPSFEQWKSRTW